MDSTVTIAPDLMIQANKAEELSLRVKADGAKLTDSKRKELKKIAQDFESVFTSMMLKSMRATVAEDKVTGGGKAEETYRYLLDQEYAIAASKRGGPNSLASMVEKELMKQYTVSTQKDGDGMTGKE